MARRGALVFKTRSRFRAGCGEHGRNETKPCGAIGKHSEDTPKIGIENVFLGSQSLGGLSSLTSPLLVHGRSFSHIQFAVKQDQALGHAVLRQVKAGQLPLGRVSFALLLSLARVGERFRLRLAAN